MERDSVESRRDEHDRGDGGVAGGAAAETGARGADGRFRKGASGNPSGKRAVPRRSGRRGDRLIGADQPTRALILAEAYRTVRLNRDGSIVGDAAREMAQHRWTELVREAEREQRAAQVVIYNALEREDYRRNPKASYEDDIILDTTAGTVLVREE